MRFTGAYSIISGAITAAALIEVNLLQRRGYLPQKGKNKMKKLITAVIMAATLLTAAGCAKKPAPSNSVYAKF